MGKLIINVDINMSSDGGADQEHDFAAGASFVHLPDIFTQIAGKRCQQDIKWGGADHDDQHDPIDWEIFIKDQIVRLTDGRGQPMPEYRARLINIAALACAAMQSWDRLHPQDTLRARVFQALENAVENGFDMQDMPPEAIAEDLVWLDADIEGENVSDVQEHVSEWLATKAQS